MTNPLFACEKCADLTDTTPDHKGKVLCQVCGGPATPDGFILTVLGESGVRSLHRAESLTPETLEDALTAFPHTITVLTISTPESIRRDMEGPRDDPYEMEREWLGKIGREHLLPWQAVELGDVA